MYYTEDDVNALVRGIASAECMGMYRAATVSEIYHNWRNDIKARNASRFEPINISELHTKVKRQIDSRPPRNPLYKTF